jgi:hypothetical protein
MARPRIFVSSTFYDLKQVRTDLERFIRDMGYDPVLHERGAIPYGNKERLEEYCYREIQQVEIFVSIIGGRFGSQSEHQPYSISQQELRTAYDLGIQVFIFVEAAVLLEYQTYRKNKDLPGMTFSYVDDPGVYRFLEDVHALPNNNPITAFGAAQDIVTFLREQWAGMFQRFLQNQGRQREVQIVKDLQANMQTLNQLVTYLSQEKQNTDGTIREILRSNHPVFNELGKLLGVTYRIFFTTRAELSEWLKARQFNPVEQAEWDDPTYEEWLKNEKRGPSKLLKISSQVFDEKGDLIIYTDQQWHGGWVSLADYEPQPPDYSQGITDDDVPF